MKNNYISWEFIDWKHVNYRVEKLQKRIAQSAEDRNWNKLRHLQKMLMNSFYARLLAVHRVTSKKSKRTPGLDGKFWFTDEEKFEAVERLKLEYKNYHFSPFMRIYVLKENDKTKTRPLSIPIIFDRAMQSLYLLAIDPVVEYITDKHAYGFRKNRSAQDAIKDIRYNFRLMTTNQWVLKADIHGCFDHISHNYLIEFCPFDKQLITNLLKCGYIYKNKYYPTEEGIPQGGVLSPVLSNLCLSNFEKIIEFKFNNSVKIVRFVDDYLISGTTKEQLEEILKILKLYLAKRNLTLSDEKTKIKHITQGVDFIGWNIKKINHQIIILPTYKNYLEMIERITERIKQGNNWSKEKLIKNLNDLITGWGLYHNYGCAPHVYNELDNIIYNLLLNWCKNRHLNESEKWIINKYFTKLTSNVRVFGTKENHVKKLDMLTIGDTENNIYFRNPYLYPRINTIKKRVIWKGEDNYLIKY